MVLPAKKRPSAFHFSCEGGLPCEKEMYIDVRLSNGSDAGTGRVWIIRRR
jgi:hypothetical protein